jgi:hypothetical protein
MRHIGLRSIATFLFFTAACILALLGFVRVILALLQIPTQLDFAAYYVAARMLNAHIALYRPAHYLYKAKR